MLDWFGRCWSKLFFKPIFDAKIHTNARSSLYTISLGRCCDGRFMSIPSLHCNLLMLSTWHGTHIFASLPISIPDQPKWTILFIHFCLYAIFFLDFRFFSFSLLFCCFSFCYYIYLVDSSQCNRSIRLKKKNVYTKINGGLLAIFQRFPLSNGFSRTIFIVNI